MTNKNNSKLRTGISREISKLSRERKFTINDLSKFFGITPDGARKKVNKNSFSVEEAISLMATFYEEKDLTFQKLVELFTYTQE